MMLAGLHELHRRTKHEVHPQQGRRSGRLDSLKAHPQHLQSGGHGDVLGDDGPAWKSLTGTESVSSLLDAHHSGAASTP